MLTTLRRIAGGVISLTGVFELVGYPGDIPTWLRVVSARVSAGTALTNRDAISFTMILVGLALLFAPRFIVRLGRYLRHRLTTASR